MICFCCSPENITVLKWDMHIILLINNYRTFYIQYYPPVYHQTGDAFVPDGKEASPVLVVNAIFQLYFDI